MTREEREKAIELLDNLRGMIEDNQGNDYDFALKKGIEALKKVVDMEVIKNMPSVTPTRKKGHWLITNDYLTGAYGTVDYVKCSCCGEESLEEGDYCPNCGSFMKGEFES